MAKRKKLNPELQKEKRALQSAINRYNRKMELQGLDRYKMDNSVKSIHNKKDLDKLKRVLNKNVNDKIITTKQGLKIKESEYRRIHKEIEKANKQLRKDFKLKQKRREEINEKWGRPKEFLKATTKKDVTIPQYTRDVEDFKYYTDLLKFEERVNRTAMSERGLHGQNLKDALLKAIRGEVTQQANGFKFKLGEDNPLAEFIEKYMNPDEVEFFFEGKLNFQFIYNPTEGLIKEYDIIQEILENPEYPILKDLWEQKYKQDYLNYFYEQLEAIPDEEYAYSSDELNAIADELVEGYDYEE